MGKEYGIKIGAAKEQIWEPTRTLTITLKKTFGKKLLNKINEYVEIEGTR